MTDNSQQVLFELIDKNLTGATEAIKNKMLAEYRNAPLAPAQYKSLRPVIREELDMLLWRIFGSFDNVGCVLPEDVQGFRIVSKIDNSDIRLENADYADMWLEFLQTKVKKTEATVHLK